MANIFFSLSGHGFHLENINLVHWNKKFTYFLKTSEFPYLFHIYIYLVPIIIIILFFNWTLWTYIILNSGWWCSRLDQGLQGHWVMSLKWYLVATYNTIYCFPPPHPLLHLPCFLWCLLCCLVYRKIYTCLFPPTHQRCWYPHPLCPHSDLLYQMSQNVTGGSVLPLSRLLLNRPKYCLPHSLSNG